MAGTIILTGANSSLAIPAIEHLMTKYPEYTLVLTIRSISDKDINTSRLRQVLSRFPHAKASIRQLDLADLTKVGGFAHAIAADISNNRIPCLAAIICNAYYWKLNGEAQWSVDGFEKSFQVSHLAHVALVLQLLGNFQHAGGRIVLFSSDAHWPGKNGLEKYPPSLPQNLDLLVKPNTFEEPASENFGRGFQRYANSKLATVMWMYALNRSLQKVCIASFSPISHETLL